MECPGGWEEAEAMAGDLKGEEKCSEAGAEAEAIEAKICTRSFCSQSIFRTSSKYSINNV
jgi:hypothetical protein